MPLFDYLCLDCGKSNEILLINTNDSPQCNTCGSKKMKKLLSAPSSISGPAKNAMPGLGDSTCCGSSPGETGCAGPGSCCGKNFG